MIVAWRSFGDAHDGTMRLHGHANLLKLNLQRQLDRARPPNLIERVETTIRAAAQTIRQHLRRPAKRSTIGKIVIGIAEVRVVQDVKGFGPETKRGGFGEAKSPLYSDIPLRRVEAPQNVAPEIALLTIGGRRKGFRIENFPPGYPAP